MSGSEDPPAVDQGAPAPDRPAALADEADLPGILIDLRLHAAHDPGGPGGQPAVTVATLT